jgi:murein DD-endopeptidase MepM/ murein hydrolase activator NlpD
MWLYNNKLVRSSQALILGAAFLAVFFVSVHGARAADINQQILDLRAQIDALTKQAAQYQGTIAQKQKEADTLNKQITILNNQILKLQVQITITGKQLDSTKLQITELEGQIFDNQQKITKEKASIGELVAFLYEQDKVNLVAMILSAPSLSTFTNEAQQTQNLSNKLTQLLTDLKTTTTNLETDKAQLDIQKTNLETLNQKRISQQNSLSGTKNSKNTLLAQTKGQEAQYQKMLSDTEAKKSEFFTKLQSLENQALQSGAFIVHVTATSVPAKGTHVFAWPFESYTVTQGYGCTSYARCGRSSGPYGGSPHNGVDITDGAGAAIHSAANGFILASGYNSGWGNWVAVRHPDIGNLVTLYAHMQTSSGLANGTAVTTSSVIGYEGATGNATGPHLHISVYKDFFTYISDKSGQVYFNYFEGTLNPFDYLP